MVGRRLLQMILAVALLTACTQLPGADNRPPSASAGAEPSDCPAKIAHYPVRGLGPEDEMVRGHPSTLTVCGHGPDVVEDAIVMQKVIGLLNGLKPAPRGTVTGCLIEKDAPVYGLDFTYASGHHLFVRVDLSTCSSASNDRIIAGIDKTTRDEVAALLP